MIETIISPRDLKEIAADEMPALAEEIRQIIIDTVNQNGGHMASNLGIVDLTIAIHRVFDSPKDHIIFDTSHQVYTHKLLTGRFAEFATLRTSGGLSGFLEPMESEHDPIVIGHAGTGPSMSCGFSIADSLTNRDGYTICVIGDGAMTSGLSYEGLSNIIASKPKNLIIILNDNGMSISPNVGWMANWRNHWLSQLRSQLELDNDFRKFEESSEALADKIPFGHMALSIGRGMKHSISKAILPNMGSFWQDMGFKYIGPIDGHNIDKMIQTLESAKDIDQVPFIHIMTEKGKGYEQAETDPVTYHQPGSPSGSIPTYSKVFCDAMGELMKTDDHIVGISAAMMTGTGLNGLADKYPLRIFDVGISEAHAVSMASAMAAGGLRPVVCIYSTFMQRAFDQILHDVCINDLPVIFGVDRAGIVGQDGKTHHGLYDIAYMRMCPNMVVSIPKDENELRQMILTAYKQRHPFSIRYPRGQGIGVPLEPLTHPLIIGSEMVLRGGSDICLLASGPMVKEAMEAAETLSTEYKIHCRVVNMRFIKPIINLDECIHGFDRLIVIEDAAAIGGVRSAVMEYLADNGDAVRVDGISAGDDWLEHASIGELRTRCGLTCQGIIDYVLKSWR